MYLKKDPITGDYDAIKKRAYSQNNKGKSIYVICCIFF